MKMTIEQEIAPCASCSWGFGTVHANSEETAKAQADEEEGDVDELEAAARAAANPHDIANARQFFKYANMAREACLRLARYQNTSAAYRVALIEKSREVAAEPLTAADVRKLDTIALADALRDGRIAPGSPAEWLAECRLSKAEINPAEVAPAGDLSDCPF